MSFIQSVRTKRKCNLLLTFGTSVDKYEIKENKAKKKENYKSTLTKVIQ